jgi:4-hydroxythreonine-4-phosphate dehydrogenase
MTLPRVGITLGDPGGVGPEIVLKTFGGDSVLPRAQYVLYGSSSFLKREERTLRLRLPLVTGKESHRSLDNSLIFKDIPAPPGSGKIGSPSAANGLASFRYFRASVDDARGGKIQALVTSPISKSSWVLAGIRWKGHTDYLSRFYPRTIMAFWSDPLKVALLTHHLSLKAALKKVTRENLEEFFYTLHRNLKKARPNRFEFLVAGLNPHAGEDGLLGREEVETIAPAVKAARRRGLKISGPYPPDVVFRAALGRKDVFVIALYHDQGLIPFKLAAFETGVNLSLGLPFARTSPDHGTAFDIAGKKWANPQSFIEAVRLAVAFAPRTSDFRGGKPF